MVSKVAIVVPVYNVERYVAECLQSIIEQTYPDWECFVVDDGSTDGSKNIVDGFARRDARFKVFHKENGGVSSARNVALDVIYGERNRFAYLCFMDPDDLIPAGFLQELVKAVREEHADMAVCPWVQFDRHASVRCSPFSRAVLDIEGLAAAYFRPGKPLMLGLCNKLFVLGSIEDIRFCERIRKGEDQRWFMDVLHGLRVCVTVPATQYRYRLRASSLTHSDQRNRNLSIYSEMVRTGLYRFSPLVQRLILDRFVTVLYDEVVDDILAHVPAREIREKISSHIRMAEESKGVFVPEGKNRRRLARLKHWPFFVFRWYVRCVRGAAKEWAEKRVVEQGDYFE